MNDQAHIMTIADHIEIETEGQTSPAQRKVDTMIEHVGLLLHIRKRRKAAESDAEAARRVLASCDAIIAECDAQARALGEPSAYER